MVKKNIETPQYVDANLKIEKDEFVGKLTTQIHKGEELLSRNIPVVNIYDPYGGFVMYGRNSKVVYDDKSKNEFIEEYKRWNSYNIELYKTSFDSPNSTYRHSYESEAGCVIYTGNEDVIAEYKKEIRRFINHMKGDIEKIELIPCVEKNEYNTKSEKIVEKKPLLFISHSSANEDIASALVTLLRTIGFHKGNLFCSSVPGYDIPEGNDIYETLKEKFTNYNIFVIFLLSKDYYESPACLNEMGATWVLKANYSTLVCPGFDIPNIRGAVNTSQMAVILGDSKRVNGKINQLKDRLIDFFNLPDIEDDIIWENDRNDFVKSIINKKDITVAQMRNIK